MTPGSHAVHLDGQLPRSVRAAGALWGWWTLFVGKKKFPNKGAFLPTIKAGHHQKKNSRISAVVDEDPVGWGLGCGCGFTSRLKHLFNSKSSRK
jgi:hypothetical protein